MSSNKFIYPLGARFTLDQITLFEAALSENRITNRAELIRELVMNWVNDHDPKNFTIEARMAQRQMKRDAREKMRLSYIQGYAELQDDPTDKALELDLKTISNTYGFPYPPSGNSVIDGDKFMRKVLEAACDLTNDGQAPCAVRDVYRKLDTPSEKVVEKLLRLEQMGRVRLGHENGKKVLYVRNKLELDDIKYKIGGKNENA